MKRSKFEYLLILILIIAVVLLGLYFWTFPKFSDKSYDWYVFGTFFGAVTGLLAFAGALFAISESNKRFIQSEERNNFYQLLDLYHKQLDLISWKAQSIIIGDQRLPKDEYCGIRFFEKISHEIKGHMLDYYLREKMYPSFFTEKQKAEDIRKQTRETCIMEEDDSTKNLLQDVDTKKKYDVFHFSTNQVYLNYESVLGSYFRTLHYILEELEEYKMTEKGKYQKLFRSQISRYELLAFFVNIAGNHASKNTIEWCIKYNFFNNLNLDDIFSSHVQETEKKDYINNLLREFYKHALKG